MPNDYQWALMNGNAPSFNAPSNEHQGGGYDNRQQSSDMPRNYQAESHAYSGQQHSSPPSSSYGVQGSQNSSYTHQSGPGSQYSTQQPQQQYGGSRTSSYTGGGGHGGGSSDLIEQSVSMQDLTRENFQGGSSPSVTMPGALLEHLNQVSPKSRDSKLYFVAPQNGGNSLSGMMYPSSDLALVNQLAVKHHRLACMRSLGDGGSEQVARGTEWSLLDEERLELTTRLPSGTVSTTVQELSLFRRK